MNTGINKSTICLLICFFLVALLPGCTGGETESANGQPVSKSDALIEIAGIYMMTQMNDAEKECNLGRPLSAYILTENGIKPVEYELYPVFAGDVIVAFATGFTRDTGEYTTGCSPEFAGALQPEYAQDPQAAVAFVYAAEGVYLVRSTGQPQLLQPLPLPDYAPVDKLGEYIDQIEYAPIERDIDFTRP